MNVQGAVTCVVHTKLILNVVLVADQGSTQGY